MKLSFDRGDKVIATINGGQWNKKKIRIYETHEPEERKTEIKDDSDEEYENKKRGPPPGRKPVPMRVPQRQQYDEPEELDLFGEYNDIQYNNPEDMLGLVNDDFYRQQKKYISLDEIERLKGYILQNQEPEDPKEAKIVRKAKKEIKKSSESELYVPDGFIVPYLDEKTSRYFIAGPTGSGKSTICANLIKQYKKQFPLNKVYLFSRVGNDPVLDNLKGIKRIALDENFMDYPPDATEDYKDSLCIFDDIDTLSPEKLKKVVLRVREDILQVCRKFGTTLICTEHHLMNYKQTRNLLLDSEFITFFPKSGSVYHLNRFLKTYAGLNKQQIAKILSSNSRSVTLHKAYPQYILSDHNVYLLNG